MFAAIHGRILTDAGQIAPAGSALVGGVGGGEAGDEVAFFLANADLRSGDVEGGCGSQVNGKRRQQAGGEEERQECRIDRVAQIRIGAGGDEAIVCRRAARPREERGAERREHEGQRGFDCAGAQRAFGQEQRDGERGSALQDRREDCDGRRKTVGAGRLRSPGNSGEGDGQPRGEIGDECGEAQGASLVDGGMIRRTFLASAALGRAAARKRVVFVCGDHEYSGELTLPLLARALEDHYGLACTVLKSSPDQNGETDIPGLDALRQADLAVFYLRWRRLPAEQVAEIDRYVRGGKPVMGYRTSSHAFNYPAGHELAAWNSWGAETFGTPPGWGADGHTHFGHESSTDVSIAPAGEGHALLAGVRAPFHARSWLYRVRPKWPPADATVLLDGKALNPNKPAEGNPVAWTWENRHGGRAFFTTLGHPEDFALEPVQRLSANAIHWCLGEPMRRWRGPIRIAVPYRGLVRPKG